MPVPDQEKTDNPNPPSGDATPQRNDPKVVRSRSGGRIYTLNALRERIEAQFSEEIAGRDDILADAGDEAGLRALLLESANYVLAVESVYLSREEKAQLLDQAYANLFGFGPLEPYLDDETLTEITIDGPDHIHARRGFGRLERLPVFFDDAAHLRRTVDRALATQGAKLVDWNYFLEIGVTLHRRPARLGLIAPPISPQLQVELRLHPRAPRTLDDLIAGGVLTREAARMIADHIAAGRGLLIIGDVGAGKTTLLNALCPAFTGRAVAVQRAAELRLPGSVEARVQIAPSDEDPGANFGAQVEAVLSEAEAPDWLILDEVRDDAAKAAWAALAAGAERPRCAWVFRGDPAPDRVRSALSMSLRRAQPAIDQGELNRLIAAKLSLVVALAVVDAAPRVIGVSAFALDAADKLILRPRFMRDENGALVEATT